VVELGTSRIAPRRLRASSHASGRPKLAWLQPDVAPYTICGYWPLMATSHTPEPIPSPSARAFVEEHHALICQIVAIVCARNRCFGVDAEDFRQEVLLKLLDGRALERFRGDCSLATFLSVVIANQFRDYRIAQWGKWRPSARATGLGPTAVRLETLRVRDGMLLEEAIETLRADPGVTETAEQLRELATGLPPRVQRRLVGDDELACLPGSSPADRDLERADRARRRARIGTALARARSELSGEDHLLLKLRFEEGVPVSQLARSLCLPQRQMYSRFDRIHRTLRRAMSEAGVDAGDVRELLGDWQEGSDREESERDV